MQIAQYEFWGALINYSGKAVDSNLHLSKQHAFSNTKHYKIKLPNIDECRHYYTKTAFINSHNSNVICKCLHLYSVE